MTTENKSLLKVEELCALIKTCSQSGVAELKFGDLHVSFLPKLNERAWSDPRILPDTEISEEELKTLQTERLEREEANLKREQLEEMQIADPYGYEQIVASGDLENGEI